MEVKRKTWYPDFDVMNERGEWDDHTQEVVSKRLEPVGKYNFLTVYEAQQLKVISFRLLYDQRTEVLDFVADHFDSKLSSHIGEAQREQGVPKQPVLIREGLKFIDLVAEYSFQRRFMELEGIQQDDLLTQLEKEKALAVNQIKIPQKALFKALLGTAVDAYYSHPIVWSEIGYAGPAYPRGYVRSEFGLTDPWEAKRNDS